MMPREPRKELGAAQVAALWRRGTNHVGGVRGLILNVTHDNVIRLLPPLVMSEDEGRQVVAILAPIVTAFLAAGGAQAKGQAPAAAAAR